MNGKQRLHVEEINGITVARFIDSRILDEESVQQAKEELAALGRDRENPAVVLNFSNVEFLTSSMLGSLIVLNGRLTASKGRLVLCNIRPEIREVFRIVRLDAIIDIKLSESEAVAELMAA